VQFDRLRPVGLVSLMIPVVVPLTAAFFAISPPSEQGEHITVLAAASMQNALDDVNAAFTKRTGVKVTAGYAASSTNIKRIAQGAVADVFISANPDWMDFGSKRKLIRDRTRVNLLGNELVLIAPKNSKLHSVPIGADGLAKVAEVGWIATGEVTEVPIGIYAKEALEKLGAWQAVEPKLVTTRHVRAALSLVGVGETQLGNVFGVVYRSDAKASPDVKIIGTFPAYSHSPIVYPVAATVMAKPEAVGYLAYLCSKTAKVIFEQYGFRSLIQPTS
jgi:molybdate transport system substrate-binding protein